ncbi:MAG: cytochrome C, partial [Sphingopyxis sp.]
MKLLVAFGVMIASASAYAADLAPAKLTAIAEPNRARINWMLKCQGCHRPDASGSPATAPTMAGEVARFLQVPGGREYLVRVPGVATAALPDDQLAELVNWSLWTFDRQNIPRDFIPYTAAEVHK